MLALLLRLLSLGSALASPQSPPDGTASSEPTPPPAPELAPAVEPPLSGDAWVFFSSSYLAPGDVYLGAHRLREGYENFQSSFDISIPHDDLTPPGAFLPLYRTPNLALQHAPGSRWLYQVHASENMIDFGEEIWALGGINVSQILGHYRLFGAAEYELPFDDLSNWALNHNSQYDYAWWWARRLSPYEPVFWDHRDPRFSAEMFMDMLPEAARVAIGWLGHFPLAFEARRPLSSNPSNSTDFEDYDYIDVEGDDEYEDDHSLQPPKKKPMNEQFVPPQGDGQIPGPSKVVLVGTNRTAAWVDSLGDVDPRLSGPVLPSPTPLPTPSTSGSSSGSTNTSAYELATSGYYDTFPYNVYSPVDRVAIQRIIELGRLNPIRCLSLLTTLIMLLGRGNSGENARQKRAVDTDSCRELWKRLDLVRKDPDLLEQKEKPSSPIPDIFNLSSVYDAEFALVRSDFSATTAQELGYLPAPAFDGIRQKKADWSVFNHYQGRTQKDQSSAYLTATRDLDKGLNRNRQPDMSTFVYVVQISNNFIPVGETLGIREPETYAVARHVSTRMIHGWLNLTSGEYERNKGFVSLGFAQTSAPAQPQLAGFPVGHGSWLGPAYHRHGRGCLFVEQSSPEPSPERLAEAMKSCTRETRLEILKRHGENFLRRLPCVAVEKLAVYMEIGDDGTTESVWAGFPYQNVLMFETASAGGSRWAGVDLEIAYREGAVLLSEMGDLEILCSSKNWHDSWTLRSLKLRGKCTSPRPAVEYDHYDRMNEEFQNTDGVKRVMWKHRLLASRWKDCEGCQVLYPISLD
ncbi:putative heat-labile enterotoxin [Ophiocordyceps camponoti-leonardi (nom. inval.)]|nr:putative heat-labile enterotoxin [Ophiocordyceps camponoti-leonardi (nom. inval.)]